MQNILSCSDHKIAAIIYCDPADPVSGKNFLKYGDGFDNNERAITKFIEFARKFPTAKYINFYGKKSRQFLDRIYLE